MLSLPSGLKQLWQGVIGIWKLPKELEKKKVLVQFEYLDMTVLGRRVGEVRVVAGRAPAC
jgi:hypothetical protein